MERALKGSAVLVAPKPRRCVCIQNIVSPTAEKEVNIPVAAVDRESVQSVNNSDRSHVKERYSIDVPTIEMDITAPIQTSFERVSNTIVVEDRSDNNDRFDRPTCPAPQAAAATSYEYMTAASLGFERRGSFIENHIPYTMSFSI
mmetsp:Transcript_12765/g.21376  ORF Transcript_12765/g.21376 Transcript_12765/m.21376 type:complete len:145 (+) Transcript_12765:3-437(+)